MSDTTRVKRRDSTKMRRATPPAVVNAGATSEAKQVKRAVRAEKVAAARKKISSVGYDLDTDFKKAMSRLLEDFGA